MYEYGIACNYSHYIQISHQKQLRYLSMQPTVTIVEQLLAHRYN
jgi:hypothetical protein